MLVIVTAVRIIEKKEYAYRKIKILKIDVKITNWLNTITTKMTGNVK